MVLGCSGCALTELCPCACRGHLGQGQRRRALPQGPLRGCALPVYVLNIAEHTGRVQLGGALPGGCSSAHSHLPDASPTRQPLTPRAHTHTVLERHVTASHRPQRDLKGHLLSTPAKMQEFVQKNSVTKYLSYVQEIMQA